MSSGLGQILPTILTNENAVKQRQARPTSRCYQNFRRTSRPIRFLKKSGRNFLITLVPLMCAAGLSGRRAFWSRRSAVPENMKDGGGLRRVVFLWSSFQTINTTQRRKITSCLQREYKLEPQVVWVRAPVPAAAELQRWMTMTFELLRYKMSSLLLVLWNSLVPHVHLVTVSMQSDKTLLPLFWNSHVLTVSLRPSPIVSSLTGLWFCCRELTVCHLNVRNYWRAPK